MVAQITTEFRLNGGDKMDFIEYVDQKTGATVRPALIVVRARNAGGGQDVRAVELTDGPATYRLNTVDCFVQHCDARGDWWELAQMLAGFGIVRVVQI